jgi:hypothetical protein
VTNTPQCDDIIKRFVSAITSVNEGSRFALTESNVYPVIRSDGLLKNLRELMHQEPEKSLRGKPWVRMDATGLVL